MTMNSIGDLARVFQSRRLTSGIKRDLARLSEEMTTGRRKDIGTAVSGDFATISRIERALSMIDARKTVIDEASLVGDAMQTTLESVQENGRAISPVLVAMQGNESAANRAAAANNARDRLGSVIAALNTNAGGRSLFAGAATDRAAVADMSTIMLSLTAAISGEVTVSGVVAAVDNWFDAPGGGFETLGYVGSTKPLGAFQISDGESIRYDVRADDPAIRNTLKGLALAALVAEGALAGDPLGQTQLLATAGERLIAADGDMTGLRAQVGVLQERVDTAAAQLGAQKTSLGLEKNRLVGVDPYEAASKVQAASSQLETYFALTAHLSRLKFTDYMR